MAAKIHLNFAYTGESWYCFVSVPDDAVDTFEAWMSSNLPHCRSIKFGHGPGQNYEIHGNGDAERMLFTMRWT